MIPDEGCSDPTTEAPSRSCVMVVEDDAALNRLLAEALRRGGCEVVQAFDGLQARELARERRPA